MHYSLMSAGITVGEGEGEKPEPVGMLTLEKASWWQASQEAFKEIRDWPEQRRGQTDIWDCENTSENSPEAVMNLTLGGPGGQLD